MSVPAGVVQIVRSAYGDSARIACVDFPGNWQVARLEVARTGGPITTVAAKWLRSNPQGWRTDPAQMLIEATGLRFVGELAPDLVPEVIAAEFDAISGGVVLLEDLVPREPLDAAIRRLGHAATQACRLEFARSLGRLGAVTIGRDQEFLTRLGTDAPDQRDLRLRRMGPPWRQLRGVLENIGVRVPIAAEQEVDTLQRLLLDPGPFLTLSNGDLAENNFMIDVSDDSDHGRVIDFEFAHFDHALTHVATFFVPGPRWMVVHDPIGDQLEQTYRSGLAEAVPEVGDDQAYETGVAAGCVAMGLERCGNLTVMDRRPAGHPSRIQRIATVEAAAAEAEARGRWSALSDLLRDLARVLRHRWPDADVDLSVFTPYTPRLD